MLRLALAALVLFTAPAVLAHGDHGSHEIGAAVIVTFAGHDQESAADWTYTIIDPDGNAWARGMCDAAGRAVFAPDRVGDWKVRVFAPDGHGGEVVVPVAASFLQAGAVRPETTRGTAPSSNSWIMGVLVGLLLVTGVAFLGRLRRA